MKNKFVITGFVSRRAGRLGFPGIFTLALAAGLLASPVRATSLDSGGSAPVLRCPTSEIVFVDHHVSAASRTYSFEGQCWYESSQTVATNERVEYRVTSSWEAPNQGREVITVVMGAAGVPAGSTYTVTFNSGADPWLDKDAPCTNRNIIGPASVLKNILSGWGYPVTRGAFTEGDRTAVTASLVGALNIDIIQPTSNRLFDRPDQVLLMGKLNLPDDMTMPANTVMVFKVWERGWPQPGHEPQQFLKFEKVTPMGYANHPVKDIPPGDWWVQARILGKESKFWSTPVAFGIKGQELKSRLVPGLHISSLPVLSLAGPGQEYTAGEQVPFRVMHHPGQKLVFDTQRKSGALWSAARLAPPQVSTPKAGTATVESRALFLVDTPGRYRMRARLALDGSKWSDWQEFEVSAPGKMRNTRVSPEIKSTGQRNMPEPVKTIDVKPAAPAIRIKAR